MESGCKCPNITCERHGNCELCSAHHKETGMHCVREAKKDDAE